MTRHRWLATLAALAAPPLCVAAFGLRLGEPAAVLARSGSAREALDGLERAGVGSGVLTPIVEVLVPAGADPEVAAGRLGGPHAAGRRPRRAGLQRAGSSLAVSCRPPRPAATPAWRPSSGSATWPRPSCPGPGSVAAAPRHRRHGQPLRQLSADAGRRRPGHLRAAGPGVPPLLLALKAIVLNLLSIAPPTGCAVLFQQEGHGSAAIWGIPATGAIASVGAADGLRLPRTVTMDYEVFLLARMREEYDATGSTETAIVRGLGRVGRLVTRAALILFPCPSPSWPPCPSWT